jgi:hypothetical protein
VAVVRQYSSAKLQCRDVDLLQLCSASNGAGDTSLLCTKQLLHGYQYITGTSCYDAISSTICEYSSGNLLLNDALEVC